MAIETDTPESVEAMAERLGFHSEDPMTGKLRLTNPDGPEAAAVLHRYAALLRERKAGREYLSRQLNIR